MEKFAVNEYLISISDSSELMLNGSIVETY